MNKSEPLRQLSEGTAALGSVSGTAGEPGPQNRAESVDHDDGLDPVTRWATTAMVEFRVCPHYSRRSPLDHPEIIYKRAQNIDLKLDVFTAGLETQKRPTLIYMHGGGWVHVWKEDLVFHMLPFLARGMNTVNVEHRRASQSPAPASVEDCRSALRWVHKHAVEYGFDESKIVVAGGSAGGHLALMTGMLEPSAGFDDSSAYLLGDEPLSVAAIVNWFGPTDVADLLEGPHRRTWAVEWMADVPNRTELAKKLSPLSYVRKGLPPIITIHGTEDGAVPYQHAVRLHEALDQVEVRNQLVTIPGGGHGWDVWPLRENFRALGMIFKFLEANGILEAMTP